MRLLLEVSHLGFWDTLQGESHGSIGGCGVQVSVLPLSGRRCSSAVSSQLAVVLD